MQLKRVIGFVVPFIIVVAALFAVTPAFATSNAQITQPSPAAGSTPAVPAAASWTFPPGVSDIELPAQFLNGVIIVRMTVGGRGVDLSLDTGTSFNVMDPAVVASLADPATTDFPFTLRQVQFGSATMSNISFASRAFDRRYGTDRRIVGILGFNFLQSAIVKIDYEHEAVHIIDPASFELPQDVAVLELNPTARVPLVSASIGAAQGSSFMIDTGAATVVVFEQLAKLYPNEFTAAHELKDDAQTMYYRSFWPVCGEIQQKPYAVSQVSLGKLGVRDWTVWKPESKSCFAPQGIDGLIGYDILRLFTVYVDYANNRVILEPNKLYQVATNTFKP